MISKTPRAPPSVNHLVEVIPADLHRIGRHLHAGLKHSILKGVGNQLQICCGERGVHVKRYTIYGGDSCLRTVESSVEVRLFRMRIMEHVNIYEGVVSDPSGPFKCSEGRGRGL